MSGPHGPHGPTAGRGACPLFGLTDVVVRLGGVTALDGVSVAIADGGVAAIVGPSGSGKGTRLRLCNRLEVAERGPIAYRGRPLEEDDPRALRREVGMVFQQATLVAGTVGDNLASPTRAPTRTSGAGPSHGSPSTPRCSRATRRRPPGARPSGSASPGRC